MSRSCKEKTAGGQTWKTATDLQWGSSSCSEDCWWRHVFWSGHLSTGSGPGHGILPRSTTLPVGRRDIRRQRHIFSVSFPRRLAGSVAHTLCCGEVVALGCVSGRGDCGLDRHLSREMVTVPSQRLAQSAHAANPDTHSRGSRLRQGATATRSEPGWRRSFQRRPVSARCSVCSPLAGCALRSSRQGS